jgi:hypothetical protein
MLPHEYTLSQYDSSPHLTACIILVILIDSSFVEQVEEYTSLNTNSSEIVVSNIKYNQTKYFFMEIINTFKQSIAKIFDCTSVENVSNTLFKCNIK